jgi:TetR/AcrR family transcriptional regulator, regulator of cefoperazone and chloramphenicol sensitivity
MQSDPSTSAGTRGDATREALIRAAIDVFGRDGFDAASTRAISHTAGVNQALIGYHFGGKPGLYLAALGFIADSVGERMGPLVDAIDIELAADSGETSSGRPDRSLELLHGLIGAFVQMLTSDESAAWARLILREQQDPSDGFDILYEGIMRRILGTTARLVARVRGGRIKAEQCRLTAVTILGQALVFRAARAAVMREMNWRKMSPARVNQIKSELNRNISAILDAEQGR